MTGAMSARTFVSCQRGRKKRRLHESNERFWIGKRADEDRPRSVNGTAAFAAAAMAGRALPPRAKDATARGRTSGGTALGCDTTRGMDGSAARDDASRGRQCVPGVERAVANVAALKNNPNEDGAI